MHIVEHLGEPIDRLGFAIHKWFELFCNPNKNNWTRLSLDGTKQAIE